MSWITGNEADDKQSTNSSESVDDFELRIFGGISGSNPNSGSFFEKLDKLEKEQFRRGWSFKSSGRDSSESLDGVDEGFNSFSDGMDGKLKKHAQYFEFNHDEVEQDDSAFIPDTTTRNALSHQLKVWICPVEVSEILVFYPFCFILFHSENFQLKVINLPLCVMQIS